MFDFKIIDSKETYKMVESKNYEYNYRIGDLRLLLIHHKAKYFDLIRETKIINEEEYLIIDTIIKQIDDLKKEVVRFEEMLKIYRSNINAYF